VERLKARVQRVARKNRLVSCLLRIRSRIGPGARNKVSKLEGTGSRGATSKRGGHHQRRDARVLGLRPLLSPIKGRGALPADRPVRVGDFELWSVCEVAVEGGKRDIYRREPAGESRWDQEGEEELWEPSAAPYEHRLKAGPSQKSPLPDVRAAAPGFRRLDVGCS
jgi:hypothetical protein